MSERFGPIMLVIQVLFGIVAFLAILSGLEDWLSLHWLIAGAIAFPVAAIPFVGPIVGIMGAIVGWGWPWYWAVFLFCWPFVFAAFAMTFEPIMGFIVAKLQPVWSIQNGGRRVWKRPNHVASKDLILFKNYVSAFEYACAHLDSRIIVGRTLAALVKEVEPLQDGRQCCTLLLQSNEGGRELLLCETLNQQVPRLQVGDFVAYKVSSYYPQSKSKISGLSVMGFIVEKFLPNWSVQDNCWWEDLTAR